MALNIELKGEQALTEQEARELLRLIANPPMSGAMQELKKGIAIFEGIGEKIRLAILAAQAEDDEINEKIEQAKTFEQPIETTRHPQGAEPKPRRKHSKHPVKQ